MDGCSGIAEVPTTVVAGGAAGTPVAGRWNPTKEQINMLENLYRQGLRTPTAEQIQEITGRLQKYGHIEGKNVFYWFQNHKARQRQKEKQDHLSLFRHYNHLHPPCFHLPPPPNVVYEPCYIPTNTLGFYVQQPATTTFRPIKRRSPPAMDVDQAGFMVMQRPESAGGSDDGENRSRKETLDLFPMHPTGILQEPVDSAGNRACTSGGSVDRQYFDFFC